MVGRAACYGLEDSGIESLWERDFLHLSRPALWPTHPPVQWVTGLLPGDAAAGAWRWPRVPSSASGSSRPVIGWNSPLPLSSNPTRATCSAHIILNLITWIIYSNIQVIKLIIQIYPVYSYLLFLRPNYLLLHPILEQPQLFLLPLKCGIPSFTPIHNTKQIIVCIYSSLCS
jgi:hypothetical protein